jgi:putative ABC transport system permease protein
MGLESSPRPAFTRTLAEVWSLAWKDLRHDRHTTLVLVLTVAAILAPLLLLLGLKNGVVETLRETLLREPSNLEVIIYGSARLDRDWLTELAARPDVAFLIPKTRTINTSLDLLDPARRLIPTVELIPTAPGDPLLPSDLVVPERPDEVLVTTTLARRLGLIPALSVADPPPGASDLSLPSMSVFPTRETPARLTAIIKRTREGVAEHLRLSLAVIGIVPEARFSRDALFTTLDLLVAAEDYRDGILELPESDRIPAGYADRHPRFANARLYARGLDQVSPLAATLSARGIEVRTQAERIATVRLLAAGDRTHRRCRLRARARGGALGRGRAQAPLAGPAASVRFWSPPGRGTAPDPRRVDRRCWCAGGRGGLSARCLGLRSGVERASGPGR